MVSTYESDLIGFGDYNCQGDSSYQFNSGIFDDKIRSGYYRYSQWTHLPGKPWKKFHNINSYYTKSDPTKNSIREINVPETDLVNRPKVNKYQGSSVTLWKGDRATDTLYDGGRVAHNDDKCHNNNDLPDSDAVIIERIPLLDNFYHTDVTTKKGTYPDDVTGSNFTPKKLKAVLDSSGEKVEVCPGTNGYGYWMDDYTVKCLYQKPGNSGPTKLNLLSDIKSIKRKNQDLWSSISSQYCLDDIGDRGDDTIDNDGNTCNGIINKDEIYSELCTGEDIKNDTCSDINNLSTTKYKELAKQYCTTNGINDDWCSCYNVMNFQTVCQTYPEDKAGCVKAHTISKNIADSNIVIGGGEDENTLLQSVAPCGELCASTSTWVPDGAKDSCSRTIQVCNQNLDIGSVYNADSGSQLDLSQICNQDSSTSTSPSPSPTSQSPSSRNPPSQNPPSQSPSSQSPSSDSDSDLNSIFFNSGLAISLILIILIITIISI